MMRLGCRAAPVKHRRRTRPYVAGGRMFRNTMPRYEILSEDAMAKLDAGWRRLVTEIGVEFMSERALDAVPRGRPAGRGARRSSSTPSSCSSRSPRRRASSTCRPATRRNTIHIGGDSMAFGAVYGPPFVREGDVRRDATMDDFRNFTKLAQSLRRARLGRRRDLRAQRHAARLAAPRHDLRAADADRQDLHGQRRLRRQRRATPSRWARSSSAAARRSRRRRCRSR